MNLPKHLRSSKSSIKEAKFNYKMSKKNRHNHQQQRNSFLRRMVDVIQENGMPDMDMKLNLLK